MMYPVFLASYGNNFHKIEFRQDPITQDIRGYRYINNQIELPGYPLKKKDFSRLSNNAIERISSLHHSGFEPTINAKGKIEWVRDQSNIVDSHSQTSSSSSSSSSFSISSRGSSSTANHSQIPFNPPLPTTQEADPQLPLRPLLPLAENPLRKTHPLGFPLGASGGDYYERYPEWCENVLSYPRMRGSSYEKEIKRCEQALGLDNGRRGLDQKELKWKAAIDRALKIIQEVQQIDVENLKQLYSQFGTIYENVYQFIFSQLRNVQNLKDRGHFFTIFFQMDFYDELKDVFPERHEAPFNDIRLKILESQTQTDVEASSAKIKKLQEEYPDSAEKIEELARLAQAFVQRKRKELDRKITDYLGWPEVISCWQQIFKRCPNLQENYNQMKRGRFSSLEEISHDPQARFFKDPYIFLFSKVVTACERFVASPQKGADELNQLQEALRDYEIFNQQLSHFDDRIEPIVFLKDLINNILQWPGVYEMAKGEKHYLSIAVYWLITISNKELTGEPKIPYIYQNIPDKRKADALYALSSPNKTTAQKREACRVLLYSRIPWKALLAIGSLFHGGGGIKPEQIELNRKLLGEVIIDLFNEFHIVEKAMADLIGFELSEFSNSPSLQLPTALPEGCFKHIHLLGDRESIIKNLDEICSILQWWGTTTLDASQVNEKRVKYAVLRTIQMIGELSKNLRQSGLFNVNDSASRCIEQLRDLLAHLEKSKVNKRLQALIEMENLPGCHFGAIIEDFRELLHYFNLQRTNILRAKEWSEMRNLQNVDQNFPHLAVKSFRALVVYLDSHITIEAQAALRLAVMGEDAKNKRSTINQITKEFLAGHYERESCEEKIKKLPLTILKKKALLSGIQSLSNCRHYYRRGAHFRSGATDPRILNVIKKYADNKKTPDDEKELFRKLIEKLSEGRVSLEEESSNEQLSPRIQAAQQQFAAIIALKRSRGTCVSELENVETRFIELTETLDGFVTRKTREVKSILDSFDAYENDSMIDHEVTRLIEKMESNSVSLDELCLSIHTLGIDGEVRWQEAFRQYEGRLAKGAVHPSEVAAESIPQFDFVKMRWTINSILEILDQLHGFLPQDHDHYHRDKTLQLSCQFLYSSFRGRAIKLEYEIEFLKSIYPSYRQHLNAIQDKLNRVIDQANDVLHVHTTTEVSTLTPFGQAFVERLFLGELAKDMSVGQEQQFTINSLRTELRTLLELIESREGS